MKISVQQQNKWISYKPVTTIYHPVDRWTQQEIKNIFKSFYSHLYNTNQTEIRPDKIIRRTIKYIGRIPEELQHRTKCLKIKSPGLDGFPVKFTFLVKTRRKKKNHPFFTVTSDFKTISIMKYQMNTAAMKLLLEPDKETILNYNWIFRCRKTIW